MLVFYPVFGIGIACATLVGQKIGQQNQAMASRADLEHAVDRIDLYIVVCCGLRWVSKLVSGGSFN